MRRIVCLAVALALTGVVRADDQADLQKVIDKAIKATGEEKFTKYKGVTFKMKGKFYGMGEGIDYTGDVVVQYPDKTRVKIEAGTGDMKFVFMKVLNGDKLYIKLGDNVQEVDDKEQIAEAKEEMYRDRLASLVPLKEKGFTLAALGEVKVEGKPAIGIRVSSKGHRDLNMFFDKDSGLLVKTESTVKDPMTGGKEETQEELYSDYKDIGGAKFASKLVINRDGKKYIDAEVSDVEPKEKLDDALFGKP
jgi:outer membrane lipoprotein-sorting protein